MLKSVARSDADKEPPRRAARGTRHDWLNAARDTLVRDGVEQVKVLALGNRIGVSRSSFYWFFRNRDDLLQALLAEWEVRNTANIVERCALPAGSITRAVCNFFGCFLDPAHFDPGLDFAVREWARRDEVLRDRVDAADAARIYAVWSMFARHGYEAADADARARILYFMQLGYHALDVREPIGARMGRIVPYLRGFIGAEPDPAVVEDFRAEVAALKLK
jgi:AcrR family transcriptional regulator